MEVQNILFSDFSLTRKISVGTLTKQMMESFHFEMEKARLLARFMVEQPDKLRDNSQDEVTYKYDPSAQLSHAKVVSRLQSVLTSIAAESND